MYSYHAATFNKILWRVFLFLAFNSQTIIAGNWPNNIDNIRYDVNTKFARVCEGIIQEKGMAV